MKKGKYKNCEYCGAEKYVQPCFLKIVGRQFFCSVSHHNLYQKERAFSASCEICGNIFFCQPFQVKFRNRKTCSVFCTSKRRATEAEKRNKENPPSQGVLNRRIRYSTKMDAWRKETFCRDDYTCQICKTRGGTLNADHIKPFALFPELRFDLSNGRTLCVECHRKTDTWGRKAIYR